MTSEPNTGKRGWLLDQLMLIGHYEAELTHDDEQILNLHHDLDNNSGDVKEVEKITDELNFRENLMAMHYEGRAKAEEDIFNAFPDIDIDKKKWCDIKHSCAVYTLASEVYHARDFDPIAKENMLLAGKSLTFLVSRTFGFEPMDCMRCLNDHLSGNKKPGMVITTIQPDLISTEPIDPLDTNDSITKTPKVT